MGLVAGAVLFAAPTRAAAAGMVFQNKLKVSVSLEAATVVGRVVKRDMPLLIDPGKTASHDNVPPGVRFINVYDANQPARLLLKRRILVPNTTQSLYFTIQPDIRGVPQLHFLGTNPPAKPRDN
jgi:hypothetical protein